MNRTRAWRIRRQTIRRSDAQTRWDQVYQHLLQWTTGREGACSPVAPLAPQQEGRYAHRMALSARVSTSRQAQAQTIEHQLERLRLGSHCQPRSSGG